jgi:hypothetical protein
MDRIGSGIILCLDGLTLRLLAGLLFYHSSPKFANLVNSDIALAKKRGPLPLNDFSRLGDRNLINIATGKR